MQRPELTQEILDYIRSYYKADYIGLADTTQEDTKYSFIIGIPSYMSPTYISCDASSDEEFLEYVFKEIRERNYMRLYIYRTIRTYDSKEQ